MPNFCEASMADSNPNSFVLEAFPCLRRWFNCWFRVCRCGSWNFKCGFASGRFAKLSVRNLDTTSYLGPSMFIFFNWEYTGLGKVYGLSGRWRPRGFIVSPAKGFVLLHGTQASRMATSYCKYSFSPLGLQIWTPGMFSTPIPLSFEGYLLPWFLFDGK